MTVSTYTTKPQRRSVRQHTKEQARKYGRRFPSDESYGVCSFICVLAHRRTVSRWFILGIQAIDHAAQSRVNHIGFGYATNQEAWGRELYRGYFREAYENG
jgi:hypothetical protein